MTIGRPTKLADEKATAMLLDLLRDCVPLTVACRKAGISYTTIKTWRARAAAEPEGPHAEFVGKVEEAIADAEIAMVRTVYAAAGSDARHAQWLLERRFQGRWSPKSKTENKHKVELSGSPVFLPDNGRDA